MAQPAPREPSPWLLRDASRPEPSQAAPASAENAAAVRPYDAWQSAERCGDPLWAAYRPSNGHESSGAEKRPAQVPAAAPAAAPKVEPKAMAEALEEALARAVEDAPGVEVGF